VPILYAFTLFVSASLLFMVQPMIGRMILPLLGGSPAAWNTCMVFFQAVLLLGYLYAHKLTAKLGPRRQVALHLAVLGGSVGVMLLAALLGPKNSPIPVVESLAPDNTAYPMFGVLALLTVAIGVPFFAVSTSAPLLQRWFAYSGHPSAKDPYFLYAASNAGSLISLLGYPLVTEPSLRLVEQAWLFFGGFVALLALVYVCGNSVKQAEVVAVKSAAPTEPPPTLARKLRWLGLAFVPSSLMLGVTTHMTTDIASIPLLWVGPLALYLVTFIIAFARTPSWFRPVLGNISPVVTLLLVFVLVSTTKIDNVFYSLLLHLVAYFLTALLCHSELARDRPSIAYLTNFYLWMSLGGMLGGVFNALVAPVAFRQAWEYPITIAVGCMLIPRLDDTPASPAKEQRNRLLDFVIPCVMLALVAGLTALPAFRGFNQLCAWIADNLSGGLKFSGVNIALRGDRVKELILYAMPAMICFFFIDRPLRFGLCVAALLFVGHFRQESRDTIDRARSFFGIMEVKEETSDVTRYLTEDGGVYDITEHYNRRRLVHGTTLHGIQSTAAAGVPAFLELEGLSNSSRKFNAVQVAGPLDPWSVIAKAGAWTTWDYKQEPLTYYHRNGPVGHVFDVTYNRYPRADFAMVGLGTGSVSCYAGAGQTLTFYEIDPVVKAMVADTDKNFTYVKDAERRGATMRFVMGDARLKLQAEDVKHKLLLVDAFSSDSIPVHLLTKEAVQLYLDRVVDDGIVALHISNRYIRLELVVAKIAQELGVPVLEFNDTWFDKTEEYPPGKSQSTWVVLAKKPEALAAFRDEKYTTKYRPETFDHELKPNRWREMVVVPQVRAWTDDYADVLSVMRIKEVQQLRGWLGLPTIEAVKE
jgi:hypothetical protein